MGLPEKSSDLGAPGSGLRVVESHRRLAGRRFMPVAEAELLPDLLRLASTLAIAGENIVAIPEYVGAFGIADLVALVPASALLEDRLFANIEPLVYEPDAAIVAALTPRSSRLPDEIARRLGWPVQAVVQRIPRLRRIGAVGRTSRGGLVRHPALVPVGRVHSFEAKVRDWRRGCKQARRYRLWADTSTVVLSHLPTSGINVSEELGRWGIGLAVSDEWVRRPKIFRHTPARRLLSSELTIAALRAPSGTGVVTTLPLGRTGPVPTRTDRSIAIDRPPGDQ